MEHIKTLTYVRGVMIHEETRQRTYYQDVLVDCMRALETMKVQQQNNVGPREKDLILLGIFHTSMNISETIGYFKPKDVSKERKRSRNVYYIRSKRVCTKTFRFLHVISKNKVSAVQQWYREQWLTPRRKKSGGRVECKRVLSYEDTKRVFQFIDNFAEANALLLPGRVAGFKRADLRLLPSTNSKASIWRDYYKPSMKKLGRPIDRVVLCSVDDSQQFA
ncbi:uncharacterized protein LOC117305643 [Asterias rubens]|uniref:uncharacterized protein LOC117305643 n=1 Tax=Asterias rubens TaxID=7604 RepID=UPI0014556ADF|nr:uncharacterized protein LOC117305643 [Asterias rubens]